ncbi:MAG TPA: ABC transporter permease [Bacilli bacterium]|jgi:simple sugar transport system permease protein|nr:ABC transporter permease [Bacilli bacterium]HOH62157.1 ABC transporter permease [Bacilli bacterium]HPB49388.1 ABC transporter permease [Bacilli bacterium]HPM14337.1 ABC transporter permease [Bacilli bacterium]HPY54384.1 ABC transporter permease [Bacilli bacterium]
MAKTLDKVKSFFKSIGRWFKSLVCTIDGREAKLLTIYHKPATKSIISSLISIFVGILLGGLILLIISITSGGKISLKAVWEGFRLIFIGVFNTGRDTNGNITFGFNSTNIGNVLFRATPLILTGLSVAVAFKTGLFNIGAPGQYLMGTAVTFIVALSIPTTIVPAWIVWILSFVAGFLAGALWGVIPGVFKAFLNVHEVITCIMTNWIAANIVTSLFDNNKGIFKHLLDPSPTKNLAYLYKTTENGVVTSKMGLDVLFPGSQVNGGIIIAIVIAIIVYIILNKTTFGYELKACGSNRHAAKYAGINEKRSIILSMAIAGGLAGMSAALYYLSGNTEFYWSTYQSLPANGFNGIPIALLAYNNPVGVIFSGIFMSYLNVAGLQLKNLTPFNEYITDIIIASIVYLSAFSLAFKEILNGNFFKRKKNKLFLENSQENSTKPKIIKEEESK